MNYNYMALFLSIVLGLSPEQAFAFIDSNVKCDKGDLMKIEYQRQKNTPWGIIKKDYKPTEFRDLRNCWHYLKRIGILGE